MQSVDSFRLPCKSRNLRSRKKSPALGFPQISIRRTTVSWNPKDDELELYVAKSTENRAFEIILKDVTKEARAMSIASPLSQNVFTKLTSSSTFFILMDWIPSRFCGDNKFCTTIFFRNLNMHTNNKHNFIGVVAIVRVVIKLKMYISIGMGFYSNFRLCSLKIIHF